MDFQVPMLYYGLHWSEHMRVAPAISLTDEQQRELARLARSRRTSVRLAQRAQIVLLAAQGLPNTSVRNVISLIRIWKMVPKASVTIAR